MFVNVQNHNMGTGGLREGQNQKSLYHFNFMNKGYTNKVVGQTITVHISIRLYIFF